MRHHSQCLGKARINPAIGSRWLTSLAIVCAAAGAQSRRWDAAAEFGLAANPTASWSYGWSRSPGGVATAFVLSGIRDGGLEWWYRGGVETFPGILANHTTSTLNISGFPTSAVAPGTMILHPGTDETYALLRWSCPCPGWYQVTSRFRGNSSACGAVSSTADVHILVNGVQRFMADILGYGSTAASDLTLSLVAGDVVTVAVGNGPGSNNGCDHIATAVTVSELGPATSPWPMHQHDARHTGRSPYVGPTSATLAWSYPLPEEPGGLAIGPDGTMYVATGDSFHDNSGHLIALTPGGTLKWSFALPTAPAMVPNHTTPAVAADGTIYLHVNPDSVAAPNRIYAIFPDGTEKWHFDLDGGAQTFGASRVSSPTIGPDGTIYVASRHLTALNPDGTLKWARSYLVNNRSASPAITPSGSILCSDLFNVQSFSPAGNLNWSQPYTNGSSDGSLSVSAAGLIHVRGYTGTYSLMTLNPNGTQAWASAVGGASVFGGTPALSSLGEVLVTDGNVKSFNAAGVLQWTGTNFWGASSEILLDGAGTVYARSAWDLSAHASNGTLLFAVNLGTASSTPACNMALGADGTLYVPVGDIFGSSQVLRAYAGTSQAPLFQTNGPAASLVVDGVSATSREAAVFRACAGSLSTLRISSAVLGPGGTWEVGIVAAPLVALGSGGASTPFGLVNLDLAAPAAAWLFGGASPWPQPWSGNRTLAVNLPLFPMTVTAQAVFIQPGASPAIRLTQACQISTP